MKRPLRQTLCVLFALVLSASLLPMGDAYAGRGGGGRGGGGRGGGGSYRGGGGGGASPRVNRSVSTQDRGNFNSRSQPSRDRSQYQQGGQGQRAERQGQRQTTQGERQGQRQTTQGERQGERTERQGQRQTTQGERQGERTERQGERQGERTERQGNRQDFIDDNYNDRWRGGGWYGGGYYVPPGWGWVGLTTGLVIGAAIATLPPYYNTVYVGSNSYIYSDGVYLQPSGSTYIVVSPPVGVVVTYLPDGCTTSQINNTLYYICSDIYYQPFFQNGSTVYRVVQP